MLAGREPRVFDVAASDGRRPDPTTRRVSPVGSSVDVARATYENRIGATHLRAAWSDPDFDPSRPSFYYARVLEIPTPRWSTHDAVRMGIPPPEPATIGASTAARAAADAARSSPAHGLRALARQAREIGAARPMHISPMPCDGSYVYGSPPGR